MTNRVGGPLWEERDDHTWASALARAPQIASRVGRVLRTSRALSLKRNSNRLVRDDSPYLLPLMFRRQLRTQALDLKIVRRSARSRALRRLPHAKGAAVVEVEMTDDLRVVRSAGVPAPPVIARRPAPRADAAIHLEPDRMAERISWIATSLRSSR